MVIERIKEGSKKLKNEFKSQTSTAILTAFGLVIALAWKDFVTLLMPSITPLSLLAKYPFIAQLYTAIIITFIAVIGILIVANWAKKPEN